MPHDITNTVASRGLALALALSASGRLAGQDVATTLGALTNSADHVVIATTQGDQAAPNARAVHTVYLQVELALKGQLSGQVQLEEPAGRCCGRALHGLLPGRYLVFVSVSPTGLRLSASGARSVVPATREVVAHVRQRLELTAPAAVATLLTGAVDSSDPRVRRDAAFDLPNLPGLELADGAARDALLQACIGSLAAGDDAVSERLLTAAVRLQLQGLAAPLLDRYLNGTRPTLETVLRRTLCGLDHDAVARGVATRLGADDATGAVQARAVRLLGRLQAAGARAPLQSLLTADEQDTAASAGSALVRLHGFDITQLPQRVSPELERAIRERVHLDRVARFRVLAPRGRP